MSNVIDYERIDFQDRPATQTPLGERNLDKMDKAIYDIATYLNKEGEFILQASSWSASGSSTYPYKLFIQDGRYSDDDKPFGQVWGMNEIETQDEIDCIKYIKKVTVGHTGITVYATSAPTVNLKLILKM